ITDSRIASGDVHSPVDGVVAGRRGEPGEHVDPGMKDLFQVASDLSAMQAVAEAEPSLLAQIHPGQSAAVVIAEAANDIYPGTVKSVGKGSVVVGFTNPNPQIRPGLSAQIRIRVAE
ncbi:MAG: HlyD family efflux transporter periplasmic adaptor subunit, partial [Bryobacteraceae bacterium]